MMLRNSFQSIRSNSTVKLWRQKELKKMYAYFDEEDFFSTILLVNTFSNKW
jgi:hypothetical protein